MSDTVIKVENLSKSYTIRHQTGERYTALRDVLANSAKDIGNRLLRRNHSARRTQYSALEEFWALNDVSFEVKQGERVGIIGRNGAGKSTLLKILSRITEPTQGRIHIKGRVASLLEVGTGFHPELTGRENIYLNGAILGMSRDEIRRKFDEIVAFAEVEKFLDTPVKRYSSGMYVRLAFAVAAHLEPEILVVDEVLAVGDAAFQKKCLGKMGDVASEGRTVLFVSHNMTAVKTLCQRAVWLEQGAIAGIGEIGRVVDDYLQKGFLVVLEKKWDDPITAPGNEDVRIRSARIRPVGQNEGEIINVETSLQFEFELWNNIPSVILNFTMHLFTIEGIYVLAVGSDAKPREKGIVRAMVKVPPNFLNDNIYTVTLQIVKDASSTLYLYPDILTFEVQDSKRSGHWMGKWPGVIRPNFEWVTEKVI